MEYRRRERLCRVDDFALPRFDSVSRDYTRQSKALLPGYGSQRDLHSDCGDLHAVHVGRVARAMGLVAFWFGVGTRARWLDQESSFRRALCVAVGSALFGDGLAGGDCCAPGSPTSAIDRSRIDRGGRSRLHGRGRLLRGTSSAIRALRLAFVRDCRHGLSLLCGALVLDITETRPCGRVHFGSLKSTL